MGTLQSQDPAITKIGEFVDSLNGVLRRHIEETGQSGEAIEDLKVIVQSLMSLIEGTPYTHRLTKMQKALASTKIARARNILAKLAPDELKNMSLAEIIALGKQSEDKSLPVDPFYGIRMQPKQTATKAAELVAFDPFYRRDMRVVLKATEYTEYDPFFKRQMTPRKG